MRQFTTSNGTRKRHGACRGDPSSQRIACKKKECHSAGLHPDTAQSVVGGGIDIMFLGCLQAIVVEVERSSWLWGGPKHSID
ncbi:unnamed protein product [Sphagnum jensenii]|uniref:Uncharacterized protein n=1 Tax=Sphagnum jensenii TaxID=128206 RepID=A0ABP1A0G1_9BRYO